MLDIKRIKDDPEKVKAGLRAKEVDCDRASRPHPGAGQGPPGRHLPPPRQMKAEQNKVSKTIPQLKKAGEDVPPSSSAWAELKAPDCRQRREAGAASRPNTAP